MQPRSNKEMGKILIQTISLICVGAAGGTSR